MPVISEGVPLVACLAIPHCLDCGGAIGGSPSRRLCERCQARHPRPNRRGRSIGISPTTATTIARRPPALKRPSLASVYRRLPGGCEGAVLRELVEARPAVLARHKLGGAAGMRDYRVDTIRKTVARLAERELVREWNGSRFGDALILSELAAERYGLELDQAAGSSKLGDTIEAAFAGCRWVARSQENAHAPVRECPLARRQAPQRQSRRLRGPGHDQ